MKSLSTNSDRVPYSMVLAPNPVTPSSPVLPFSFFSSLPAPESKKVTDFTIRKLTESQPLDWSPFLISILSWTSKFPPLSHQNPEDRKQLLINSWHSLFLFYYSTHFSNIKEIKKNSKIEIEKRDEIEKLAESLGTLKLNPIEQWAFACVLIFRSGMAFKPLV